MQILERTHTPADCSETIVCHCLQVSESTLADAIAVCGVSTVRELCQETGAGGGCTACHARLRDLLRKTREAGLAPY
jgi:bacterioferritin-associated ferredoxin